MSTSKFRIILTFDLSTVLRDEYDNIFGWNEDILIFS